MNFFEQREEYMVTNYLKRKRIRRVLLLGTCVMVALNKDGIYYLKTDFRREVCQFIERFLQRFLALLRDRVLNRG